MVEPEQKDWNQKVYLCLSACVEFETQVPLVSDPQAVLQLGIPNKVFLHLAHASCVALTLQLQPSLFLKTPKLLLNSIPPKY